MLLYFIASTTKMLFCSNESYTTSSLRQSRKAKHLIPQFFDEETWYIPSNEYVYALLPFKKMLKLRPLIYSNITHIHETPLAYFIYGYINKKSKLSGCAIALLKKSYKIDSGLDEINSAEIIKWMQTESGCEIQEFNT